MADLRSARSINLGHWCVVAKLVITPNVDAEQARSHNYYRLEGHRTVNDAFYFRLCNMAEAFFRALLRSVQHVMDSLPTKQDNRHNEVHTDETRKMETLSVLLITLNYTGFRWR